MRSGPWCCYEEGRRGSGGRSTSSRAQRGTYSEHPGSSGKVLRFPSVAQDEVLRSMIILENLTKSFGTRAVLNGVSLDVPDGQNTVIIGSSGAGKSVTLKLIVGLLQPDGGRVLVDDED